MRKYFPSALRSCRSQFDTSRGIVRDRALFMEGGKGKIWERVKGILAWLGTDH